MDTKKLMTNKYAVFALVVLCTLLWGTAPAIIKIGYRETVFGIASSDIPAQILFAGARFVCAGLMLLAFGLAGSGRKILPEKKDIKPVILLGFSQTFFHYLFTFVGVAHTTASKAAVFTAATAFISVLFAPLFFRDEKLTLKAVLGCIVGFSGIIYINFDKSGLGGFSFLGEGFVLLSCICNVAGNFISKVFGRNISALKLNGWQMLFGGVVLVAVGVCTGGRLNFTSGRCYLIIIYLAAVSAIAFTLWTKILVYNPAGRISIFNLLIPLFSTAFSGLLLKENVLTFTNLFSLTLVCAGIALVNSRSKATLDG